jgi:cytochrome c2
MRRSEREGDITTVIMVGGEKVYSPMSQLFTGIPDAQERADIITYLKTVPAQ